MVTKRTVYAGTCFRDNELVCGVVQEQDFCDDGTWAPPHVVADMGHPNRICAYYPDRMVIGRCDGGPGGSGGWCSNLASRCGDPESFVARDPTCRVTHDERSGVPTTYGRCGETRCVWSPEDCSEGEDYTPNDTGCTADRVELGACLDGFGYCTVSPKTCANVDGSNTTEPYYTHEEFLDKFDTNCYLGDVPKAPPPVAPAAPPPGPAAPATPSSNSNTHVAALQPPLSRNAVVGIVVGIALVIGVVLGYWAARHRRLRACRDPPPDPYGGREGETPKDPPPATIAVGGTEHGVDDCEDLSVC